MTTYTVGSPEYAAACERAEEQIRDDLKAGDAEDYIGPYAALEHICEIMRIHQQAKRKDEGAQEWIARIDSELDQYIQRIIDAAVENNVVRVAQENQQ